MNAVVMGRANLALIFLLVVKAAVPGVLTAILILSMGTPCCLYTICVTTNTAFASTSISVYLEVISTPFQLTSGTLKEAYALYDFVFSHFHARFVYILPFGRL